MTRMVFVIVKHESLKHVGIRGGACERECEFEKESVGEGLTLMDGKVKGLELKAGRRFGWRSVIDKCSFHDATQTNRGGFDRGLSKEKEFGLGGLNMDGQITRTRSKRF